MSAGLVCAVAAFEAAPKSKAQERASPTFFMLKAFFIFIPIDGDEAFSVFVPTAARKAERYRQSLRPPSRPHEFAAASFGGEVIFGVCLNAVCPLVYIRIDLSGGPLSIAAKARWRTDALAQDA